MLRHARCRACCACLRAQSSSVHRCSYCLRDYASAYTFYWVLGPGYQDAGYAGASERKCHRCQNDLGEERSSPFFGMYPQCQAPACRIPQEVPGEPNVFNSVHDIPKEAIA
jgi:hypothetical protein